MSEGGNTATEASILASLDVGPRKAVAYLPLDTISDLPNRDPQ